MSMQGTPGVGELTYTLTGLMVASLNADGTYDAPVAIANGQLYGNEPESDTDKLRGYGSYSEGLAVPIGCKLSLKAGGVDYDALEAMGAVTISSSGTTPNVVQTIEPPAGGEGLGYFGIIGTTAAKNGALVAIGHPKVMLENIPSLTADGESNKFNLSEVEAYSFPQNSKLFRIRTYETAADFTAPSDGVTFAAFFA